MPPETIRHHRHKTRTWPVTIWKADVGAVVAGGMGIGPTEKNTSQPRHLNDEKYGGREKARRLPVQTCLPIHHINIATQNKVRPVSNISFPSSILLLSFSVSRVFAGLTAEYQQKTRSAYYPLEQIQGHTCKGVSCRSSYQYFTNYLS